MPSSKISSLAFVETQLALYYGIPIFIAGSIGGILSIIVFLSLRIFQQNSCALYLIIMSIVNVGLMLITELSRTMISGFNIDWTQTSVYSCQITGFVNTFCTLMSRTCFCLANIDQYFATCSRPHWQQWSTIKLTYCILIAFNFIWSLHSVLYSIFYQYVLSPLGKTACSMKNDIFIKYHSYGYLLVLTNFLPIFITVIFGLMSYHNIRQLAHRTIPIIRRDLDKQLIVMVLVQALIASLTLVPYGIVSIYSMSVTSSDSVYLTKRRFTSVITLFFQYLNFALSYL